MTEATERPTSEITTMQRITDTHDSIIYLQPVGDDHFRAVAFSRASGCIWCRSRHPRTYVGAAQDARRIAELDTL